MHITEDPDHLISAVLIPRFFYEWSDRINDPHIGPQLERLGTSYQEILDEFAVSEPRD
ncbi:MAG: hypothetical protein HY832_00095, partial [Candidatus Aenigmarchaeota archaeon]|nr:hypothetical protein [Candidatus Aenigmarchaeota archaeon]